MIRYSVLGACFGDEGKGKVVSYLCSKEDKPLIVRFSSGPQCGHQVMLDYEHHHVFSHFGAGALQGSPTYWMKYCPVNPINLFNEYIILRNKGIKPVLYLDKKCPIITPYDVHYNRSYYGGGSHGTVGQGVGATIGREESHYSLLVEDIYYPSIFRRKLNLVRNYYRNVTAEQDIEKFVDCCNFLLQESNTITIVDDYRDIFNYQFCLIFEGPQGLLLDQNYGFFPHVTRANTGLENIKEYGFNQVYIVTRAYQTRHGKGPMTNEGIPHSIKENPYEKNINGLYQGEFRRTLLDLDLLTYGFEKHRINRISDKTLVITCLDLVENEYRFTCKDKIVNCTDEKEFVTKIGKYLDFNKILISRSPICNEMEEFQD